MGTYEAAPENWRARKRSPVTCSPSSASLAVALHAREHTTEAGPEQKGLARDAPGLDAAGLARVFAQHAQHAPLLVAQAVLAQAGAGVLHHGLARLQQQARQVAVGEGGTGHDEHYLTS